MITTTEKKLLALVIRITFFLLLSLNVDAQKPVKLWGKPKGKTVSTNVTPSPPSNLTINDVLNTFTFNFSSGYGTIEHEYSLNSGSTWATLSSLPVSVGNNAYAIGTIRARVKAATGRNVSSSISNATAFTIDAPEPEEGIVINMASEYGITGGTGVNNTTALMQFNTDYQSEDNLLILDFRSLGAVEIRYSDPTWLFGIDSFKVWGNGCTFRCTSTSPFATEKTSFTSGGIFWQNRYAGTGGLNTGYKFNTVSAGASTITTNESGYSLSPGDRVYICAFEEQGYGEPVNPRFFEWKIVDNVSGSDVTFTEPLKWAYNSSWKDFDMPGFNPPNGDGTGLFGKPRMYKIPATYGRYGEFVNCIMGKGTNVASEVSAYFFFKAETVICDSVTIGEDWPTETKVAIRRNCTITDGGDLDKNVGLLEYNNCTSAGLSAATGVDSLRLINSDFTGNMKISPRATYAEGNTFSASNEHNWTNHPEGTWIQSVYLKNNTFTHTLSAIGNQPHVVFYTSTFTTTTGTNSSQLIVSDGGTYNPPETNWSAVKAIGFGSTITGTSGKSATVTNITHNGTNWVFTLSNVVGTPASGQTWTYGVDQKVSNGGGNISTNDYDVYDTTP